jgi:hypothetical protein
MSINILRYTEVFAEARRKFGEAVVQIQGLDEKRATVWRVRADGLRNSIRVARHRLERGEIELAIEILTAAIVTAKR